MFLSIKRIPHPIPPADKPDPKAAQALQEGLGVSSEKCVP
jgi:Mn-containing catalase